MKRHEIPMNKFNAEVFNIWNNWLLLTVGIFEDRKFNTMTIAWGAFGMMWKHPVILVGVRPSRYTWEFMETYDTFTVCSFSKDYKKALSLMGTTSGRDTDKITESNLTPCSGNKIDAPGFEEAELTFECKKIYFDDIKKENSRALIQNYYHEREYHRLYIGEIVGIYSSVVSNTNDDHKQAP